MDRDWLAKERGGSRAHLISVAYRMLGSRTEADDAVQESWLRLSRSLAPSTKSSLRSSSSSATSYLRLE